MVLPLKTELTTTAACGVQNDDKKMKHRLLVKRLYYKKLNTLSELREQACALGAQYNALLEQMHAQSDERVARGEVERPGASMLRDLYIRLTRIKNQQQKENDTLRKLTHEHVQFQKQLRQFTLNVVEVNHDNCPVNQPMSSACFVKVRPLTKHDCCEVLRPAIRDVMSFIDCKNRFSSSSEVFGWSHSYRFSDDGKELQYSISKTFTHLSAYELASRGWAVMTCPKMYASMHSASVKANLYPIQHVNADNRVLFRLMKRSTHETALKTLLLASQFQVDNGYLAIYRSLDHAWILKEEATPYEALWMDMFSWSYYEDLKDSNSVRFEFGGRMQHHSADNAQFWMMEVLLLALRWENFAVGPLFTLTS